MEHSYYAKITDIHELHYFHSDYVRWLDPEADFQPIKEYFCNFDIHNDTDTYFGINLKELKTTYSLHKHAAGRLCGFIENGKILSFANVEFCTQKEWELGAISTHPDYMGKGFSKAVCSFATRYILEHHRVAICQTHPSNFAMQAVMKQIGMKQYLPNRE
ncbi:MAG: GNAT family N-acetyltransferase [Clostridia bacterium]|nr:GNAT family N-acetyltransferase [Clostridia bacterium]